MPIPATTAKLGRPRESVGLMLASGNEPSPAGGQSTVLAAHYVRSFGEGQTTLRYTRVTMCLAGIPVSPYLGWNPMADLSPPREKVFNVPGVVLALTGLLALIHVVLAFLLTIAQTNDLLALFAFSPLRYADAIPPGLPNWWGPRVWTPVTYAFFHVDLSHLIFNLLWLLAFGPPVARRFGVVRFLAFGAFTAAAGAAAHYVTHVGDFSPMIGASATISGLMAAAMRFVFQRGGPLGMIGGGNEESYRVPAAPLRTMARDPRVLGFLAVWFGINFLFGVGAISMPGLAGAVIAWEAHVGGFVAGLLGFSLFDPVRPDVIDSPPITADDTQ